MSKNSHCKPKSDGWRYQAVYDGHTNDMGGTYSCLTICEVYLDEEGKLKMWTENSSIAPSGETLDELAGDLYYMLDDIRAWKPVQFKDLKVGMKFERDI